ncbi:hypothetical protein SAMN02910358_00723 [Lachnospiraceae bacterium XBB1006]|nr:hypothetical protein SAMN02910358_00723 [Lachnospiraceae bacterium XBB1006]
MIWDDNFMNHGAFMDFMGYRYVNLEAIIEDCLEQAYRGEKNIEIDGRGLTDYEIEYVMQEVRRRLGII